MIVEGTIMRFCMSMLWAVNVTTFAFCLDESDFATAIPALALVFLYFWCFHLHLFFRLLILHLWVSHLNWLSLNDWLLWLFRFFLGLDFWLGRFRDLLLRLDSFCNFFYQFFDWWLSFYFLLLSSWLLFEAFRTEEVRILGAVECFAVATELLLYVVIVLGFHFVRRWLSLVWRCDLCSWLWTE